MAESSQFSKENYDQRGGVRLESGRPRVRFPLFPGGRVGGEVQGGGGGGYFLVES